MDWIYDGAWRLVTEYGTVIVRLGFLEKRCWFVNAGQGDRTWYVGVYSELEAAKSAGEEELKRLSGLSL